MIKVAIVGTRSLLYAATCAAFLVYGPAAVAADPAFPNKKISLAPNQQPVADTIRDLFNQSGLSAKVSTKVSGRVSAKWVGTPAEIWKQISRAYNLVAYYDGSTVRIYDASEIVSRTIPTADPKMVEQQAAKLRLVGTGNSVRATKNAVIVSGVPAFIDSIAQLAGRTTAPTPPPAVTPIPPVIASGPPVTSTAAVASDIVSPLNTPSARPQSTAALGPAVPQLVSDLPYKLDYTVSRSSGPGYPYEMRIYNLKYAKAIDRITNAGDYEVVIPGVATLLQQIMGGGSPKGVEIIRRGTQGTTDYNDAPQAGPYGPGPYGYPPYPQQQEQQRQQQNAAAASPDGPSITANPFGNGVIVVDRPARMSNFDALVTNLDRPRSHVEIEVYMADITTSSEKNLGVDWQFGFGGLGGLFEGSVSLGGPSNTNVTGTFAKSETSLVRAKISALSRKGQARVYTRPTLTTLENEPVVGDYRQTIPVRFSGQYQGGIRDYRIGVFMAVTPQVAKEADGLVVNMQLDIRTGKIDGFLPDGIPLLGGETITNSVSIRQGESLIISGISTDSEFEDNSKVPVLGDVPVAGQLFRKKTKSGLRTERVMIVTPRVQSLQANTLVSSQDVEDEEEKEVEELSNKPKKAPEKKSTKRKKSQPTI
jgi:type III secretion protein C